MLIQNILMVNKMIRTDEYYGGTYPEPNEVYDDEPSDWEDDDYLLYMADVMYEENKLGIGE